MPLGCPAWYRTFLQGRSCNICQNAPPSNFFHSNFPSFQHGGHFFFLVSISDPSFPSVHSSCILLHENFSLPLCFSSLMSEFLTPVSNSSPPTADEHRGNHFFLLAALSVSNTFFPPSLSLSLCLLLSKHCLLKETHTTKALESKHTAGDVTDLYKMTGRNKTTQHSFLTVTPSRTD